jgi:hypothetical protein
LIDEAAAFFTRLEQVMRERVADQPISPSLAFAWPASGFGEIKVGRRTVVAITAAATTGVWALLLYLASWAVGIAFETFWVIPVLATIFLMLLFGLSMAAAASDHLPRDDRDPPAAA